MLSEKSLEQFKHIERISRQTRHYRIHLNHQYHQKLDEKLDNLTNEYQQLFLRSKTHRKLEEQRKEILDTTIQQIAHKRQSSALSINPIQILPKDNETRPLSSIKQSPTRISCHFFSHNCQLYPCQPIYRYTSFMKKEHDQTVQERNPSATNSNRTPSRNTSANSRPLSSALHTQRHLAKRHAYMEHTKARLDEQSRLLHEQLAEKKNFGYVKDHQHELQQAIQHHLKLSAKFCA
jgi:hypothetical protein